MSAEAIAKAYIESAESILEAFSEALIQNSKELNLTDQDIQQASNDALKDIYSMAIGCIAEDIPWSERFRALAITRLEETRSGLIDHLQSKVALRALNLSMGTAVSVTGSQIGYLVIGSVNQSQLSASVQQVVQRGGDEAEAARIIQSLIDVIGRIDQSHKEQQAELYDLVKGLVQQINLPKQERSPSTIRAIWDRIVQASVVSGEVMSVIQQLLPFLPALMGK